MKNHFISQLYTYRHNITIILFVVAVLLISIPLLVGPTDKAPIILMLFMGIALFFYAVLYPWFSGLDSENLKTARTILVVAVSLIAISLLIGTTDDIPMILTLLTGIVLFFYAVLYPWGKQCIMQSRV
jgi:hypothetical protein